MNNDRFKFRVWDEELKSYTSWCSWEIQENGKTAQLFVPDHRILEQCTGLQDKNGKLVYEGDIIDHNGCKPAEVVWSKRAAKFCYRLYVQGTYGRKVPKLYSIANCEIIGNIHGNPELLEGI